jgi:hypothetical protein
MFRYKEDNYPYKFYSIKGLTSVLEIRKQARKWCQENAIGHWTVDFYEEKLLTIVLVQFSDKKDAMLFKLGFDINENS